MATGIFRNDVEEHQHEQAIQRLCQQYPDRQDFIRQSYLANLEPLSSEATVRTYLSIFVSRQVQMLLKKH